MSEDIRYFPVNWIDGMKINKNHFIALQHYIEDQIRDTRNLNINYLNYGLLPTTKPFEYLVTIDTHNELSVTIKNLKIITPGGGRIEVSDYTEEFQERITLENVDFEEKNHFLILNIDPFQRIPSGVQNMEEIPPRFPHTSPRYFLTSVFESEVNNNNIGPLQFPIAKFKASGDTFEMIDDFIPPCTTIKGHQTLINLHETYEAFFKQLEFAAIQISQKIKFRRLSGDDNLIADIVYDITDKLIIYLGQTINNIRWKGLNASPSDVLNNIVSLARVMKNTIDSFSGDGKEMLYNYFCEWTDMKTGDYEKLFLSTINLQYKSYDLAPTVAQAMLYMNKINHLFDILNQLDYIGRKRDSGIFVNENVVKTEKSNGSFFKKNENGTEEANNNSSPSFLAD